MVSQAAINEVVRRIAQTFRPDRIILFGSYAYGAPNEDSDVDSLIVMPVKGRPAEQCTEVRRAVHAGFPLDLLAYPAEHIERRIADEDFFLREVLEKGRVVYEADHAGVGLAMRAGRWARGVGGTTGRPG